MRSNNTNTPHMHLEAQYVICQSKDDAERFDFQKFPYVPVCLFFWLMVGGYWCCSGDLCFFAFDEVSNTCL